MMDVIFDQCVLLLAVLAGQLGLTYEAVNVWLFVIIWPAFTLALIAAVILQRSRIQKLLGQQRGV